MARPCLLAAVAVGALGLGAQPAAARPDASRMAETMRDPQLQSAVSAAVRAMGDAMLDIPVGPLLGAAEAVRDPERSRTVDPRLTLGDIAGPDAGAVTDDLSRRLPSMMGAIGGMADAVEAMTPALDDVARQMSRALGTAIGAGYGAYSRPRE